PGGHGEREQAASGEQSGPPAAAPPRRAAGGQVADGAEILVDRLGEEAAFQPLVHAESGRRGLSGPGPSAARGRLPARSSSDRTGSSSGRPGSPPATPRASCPRG